MNLGKISLSRLFVVILLVFSITFFTLTLVTYTNVRHGDKQIPSLNELSDLKDKVAALEQKLELSKKNAKIFEKSLVDSMGNKKMSNRIGVLVISCNRPSVTLHIDQLLKHRKYNEYKFPIVISQDCAHEATKRAILTYVDKLYAFIEQPDQSEITNLPSDKVQFAGYYKISRHYKYALDKMFIDFKFESVIITEDDLNIATDFFQYFDKMNELLHRDSSLFCISAWNDNGKRDCIKNDPELLHRTDFFPGLGWMLTRSLWLELRNKWPEAFWDDWLRNNQQRKNRSCIRPEISRTEISSIGKFGTSNGQFYDTYLKYIILNIKHVDWLNRDVNYLIKETYDKNFHNDLTQIQIVSYDDYISNKVPDDLFKIKIKYSNLTEFSVMANYLNIMNDAKDGVPRTAYNGIVHIYKNNKDIYLVP